MQGFNGMKSWFRFLLVYASCLGVFPLRVIWNEIINYIFCIIEKFKYKMINYLITYVYAFKSHLNHVSLLEVTQDLCKGEKHVTIMCTSSKSLTKKALSMIYKSLLINTLIF